MTDSTQLSSYDYNLPAELIAQFPAEPRDHSRLMVIDRVTQDIQHRHFYELPEILEPGDCLILNETKVVPARLYGVRTQTGGKWEGLFLREADHQHWMIIGQTRGRLTAGETLSIHSQNEQQQIKLKLIEKREQGEWLAQPESDQSTWEILEMVGHVPIPPYIRSGLDQPEDHHNYQTIYAQTPGSAAAPTAGLHFTDSVFQGLSNRGISTAQVTLHVGLGTFRPISVDSLEDHQMHAEWCEITAETVKMIEKTKQLGHRVIAVGSTSVRSLETAASSGTIQPFSGNSSLFIRPGFEFHAIDGMMTNFHLPKSSLIVMVSALLGHEHCLAAYRQAIEERYRFYSYGDAMLIL